MPPIELRECEVIAPRGQGEQLLVGLHLLPTLHEASDL
jgi:hypothetical protein